jgi:hypothetical protein
LRQVAEDGDTFSNIFSVTFAGQTSVKSRVIMSYLGDNNGTGTWTCAKDRGIHCGHIMNARHELQRLVQIDPTATDCALHKEDTEHVVPGAFYSSLHTLYLSQIISASTQCYKISTSCHLLSPGAPTNMGLST